MRTTMLVLALFLVTGVLMAAPAPLRHWSGMPDGPLTTAEEQVFWRYFVELEVWDKGTARLAWEEARTNREKRALVRRARELLIAAERGP